MSVNLLYPLERPTTINMVHETCYRVWWTMDVVMYLLEKKTPHEVIIDYIQSMKDADGLGGKP